MNCKLYHEYQNISELLNGKRIPISEAKAIYQSLLNAYETNAQEIVDSVERNDYVRLSQLVIRRNNICTALKELEDLYEEDLPAKESIKNHFAETLKNGADITKANGKDVLLKVANRIEKVNRSVQDIITKTVAASFKSIT